MMLQCSPGKVLARAAFMHHDDKGCSALKQYVASKRLKILVGTLITNSGGGEGVTAEGCDWERVSHYQRRKTSQMR